MADLSRPRRGTTRRARTGVKWDQLEDATTRLVTTAIGMCVSLAPPDDGISEPDVLRRADGTSVYRVAGSTRYTSQRILFAERRIIDAAGRTGGRKADHNSVDAALLAEVANGTALNAGQTQLVRDLATSGRRVQLALAPAGTGKTTAMRALGSRVDLQRRQRPRARAVGDRRLPARRGTRRRTSTPTPCTSSPTRSADPNPPSGCERVDANTLLIIDEAGMADTLRLDYVISWAIDRGASVRLVGDDQQLGAVSAGGILRDIAAAHGAVRLDEVMRFANPAEAYASLALRDGDPAALGFYLDHDRVHAGDADHRGPTGLRRLARRQARRARRDHARPDP